MTMKRLESLTKAIDPEHVASLKNGLFVLPARSGDVKPLEPIHSCHKESRDFMLQSRVKRIHCQDDVK